MGEVGSVEGRRRGICREGEVRGGGGGIMEVEEKRRWWWD